MVRPHPTPDRVVLRGWRGCGRVLHAVYLRPPDEQGDPRAVDARARARDRPQHPVHALVDAVHRLAGLVDRQADAPPFR